MIKNGQILPGNEHFFSPSSCEAKTACKDFLWWNFELNTSKGEPCFSVDHNFHSHNFDSSCSFSGEIWQKASRKLISVFLLPLVAYVENLWVNLFFITKIINRQPVFNGNFWPVCGGRNPEQLTLDSKYIKKNWVQGAFI